MADIDPELQTALARLGYTEEWLALGIVDRELLLSQLQAVEQPGADPHTEHYRYDPFWRFLRSRETFTDEQVATLLRIARTELGLGLGATVYHDLAEHGGLTASQFEAVADAHSDNSFNRVVQRESYRRQIRSNPHDLALIDAAITYALGHEPGSRRDSVLERWLVDCAELTEAQLERLAASGVKAIRNLAKIRLQKLRKAANTDDA
jgi:hypothetical protein